MVPYLKTVSNKQLLLATLKKLLATSPPTYPYFETIGSYGSLFRNWIATPLPTAPYLETIGSNGSLFRN